MHNVEELIESYNDYLSKVPAGAMYIANSMREEKLQEALLAINDFSEGVLWLFHANTLLELHDIFIHLKLEKLREFLNEINEGLVKQDYVLVADIFEYEVAPFFEEVEPIQQPVQ